MPNKTCYMQSVLRLCWLGAWLTPTAFLLWMLVDGEFYRFVSYFLQANIMDRLASPRDLPQGERWLANPRTWGISALFAFAAISIVGVLLGHFAKIAYFRNIKSLFAMTTLTAYWLGISLQSNSIVEFGREHRLRLQAESVMAFLTHVDHDWEGLVSLDDASVRTLALQPHTAYPVHQPTMCMFLGKQPVPQSSLRITGIERTKGQAIRVELADSNRGYWIEYRSDHSIPHCFIGGLGERFTMRHFSKLDESLYLVRYDIDQY